ncbi:NnrU family protein [uncultured Cohaesibacter sp.]|uniref:NnrU family protein n=1 Tax=uncultured Cohaesibacter sp. TaxID=1002546 RepID=UPI0029C69723|nr:NnrU family protein [uncultured Cohaesibacter sp.]
MILLLVGVILFLAIHLVPQRAELQNDLYQRFGVMGYRLFHGAVALLAVGLIYVGYFEAKDDVILWYPPLWTRHLAATFMLFASILAFAGLFKGKIKQKLTSPFSIAIKTWAFAHLLANGSLADLILFGFFLFYGVSYRISLKRRIAAGLVVVPDGTLKGDLFAFLLGSAFYAAMIFGLHEMLFGVSPLL